MGQHRDMAYFVMRSVIDNGNLATKSQIKKMLPRGLSFSEKDLENIIQELLQKGALQTIGKGYELTEEGMNTFAMSDFMMRVRPKLSNNLTGTGCAYSLADTDKDGIKDTLFIGLSVYDPVLLPALQKHAADSDEDSTTLDKETAVTASDEPVSAIARRLLDVLVSSLQSADSDRL